MAPCTERWRKFLLRMELFVLLKGGRGEEGKTSTALTFLTRLPAKLKAALIALNTAELRG